MRPSLLVGALLLGALLPAAADAATCACEHAGSQYDGICEATTWPLEASGEETFTWQPWGSAWLPYPPDPGSGFAYYTARPGQAGGLDVTVTLADGSQTTVSCAFHTGGD